MLLPTPQRDWPFWGLPFYRGELELVGEWRCEAELFAALATAEGRAALSVRCR